MKYYQGKFKPNNPNKYRGDPTNIIYRSLWEFRVMRYLDNNSSVLQWSSEELIIPYVSPLDNRVHRYFPDFWVKMKDKDGNVTVRILEVKPEKQTKPPAIKAKSAKPTKRYINEVATYGINSSKWKAANEYCKDRGWTFHVITEKDLDIF